MLKFLILLVLVLGFIGTSSFAFAQYYDGPMFGNFGIAATTNDPFSGQIASIHSIHVGGGSESYHSGTLESISRTYQTVYDPGRDTSCKTSIATIDEMVSALNADSLFIESDGESHSVPSSIYKDMPRYGKTCLVQIHALDDSFVVSYSEMLFINENIAKNNYPSIVEQELSDPNMAGASYTENNLGTNSIFISNEKGSTAAYIQIFQKDEYIVRIVSWGDNYHLLDGDEVQQWGEVLRNRVNIVQFENCSFYYSADDAASNFGSDNNARYESKLYDEKQAKMHKLAFVPKATKACVNHIGFPHTDPVLEESRAIFTVFSFNSIDDSKSMYIELLNQAPDTKTESTLLYPNSPLSKYTIVDDGNPNTFTLVFLNEKDIGAVYLGGVDRLIGGDYSPWGFYADNPGTIRASFNNFVHNYFVYAQEGIVEKEPLTTTTSNFSEDFEEKQQSVSESTTPQQSSDSSGGGCLIATAAYGTELAPQVQFLREIRDNTVMSTASGASFMTGFNQIYYSFSPTIADWERENPMFQEVVKVFITPMLSTLSIMTMAEEGSESQVLGLGISIILLNLGMYVGIPAMTIWKIKKRILYVPNL